MSPAGRFLRRTSWSRAILVLPFIGVALVLALDGASRSPDVTFEPALTVGPALAAVVSNRTWYPLVIGLLTSGVALGLAAFDHTSRQSVNGASVFAIVLIAVIGAASVKLRNRQEKALAEARLVSEVAQRVLLRPLPDRIGPVRAAVHYAAAAAHATIGGDLYEVMQTRYGVRAVIGDVRGKGLGAVETAAAVLGAFREAAHQEPALDKVAAWLAVSLDRILGEVDGEAQEGHAGLDEEFVTLVLVSVGLDGVTEIVNCGHPGPLLLRGDEPSFLMEPEHTVPPLGVLQPAEVCPPVLRFRFEENDRLLLYTDGVIEARDRWGVFYPLADRLQDCAVDDNPADVLERVHEDVRRHVGHQPGGDDAAMLLLQYEPVMQPRAGVALPLPLPSHGIGRPRGATGEGVKP